MAHQIITKETGAGMRQFRINFYEPRTYRYIKSEDIWAASLNEAYLESFKTIDTVSVVMQMENGKWVERLHCETPLEMGDGPEDYDASI
jgi:hypothetical protein